MFDEGRILSGREKSWKTIVPPITPHGASSKLLPYSLLLLSKLTVANSTSYRTISHISTTTEDSVYSAKPKEHDRG
jgi:hypothetical protein